MNSDPAPPWRVFDASPASSPAGAADGRTIAVAAAAPVSAASVGQLVTGGRLAIAAGLLAAIGGLALAVVLASGGLGDGVTLDPGSGRALNSTDGPRASGPGGGPLIVDVTGAVLRPGLYHLAAGARLGDAIAAAGGYSPRVATEVVARGLNLAALVHDGDLIVVPSRDDPVATTAAGAGQGGGTTGGASGSGGGSGGGTGGGALVDLNIATAESLDGLPGIGPVTAAKIIASRVQSPFTSVDDLISRKLVGQKIFDQLRTLVTVH